MPVGKNRAGYKEPQKIQFGAWKGSKHGSKSIVCAENFMFVIHAVPTYLPTSYQLFSSRCLSHFQLDIRQFLYYWTPPFLYLRYNTLTQDERYAGREIHVRFCLHAMYSNKTTPWPVLSVRVRIRRLSFVWISSTSFHSCHQSRYGRARAIMNCCYRDDQNQGAGHVCFQKREKGGQRARTPVPGSFGSPRLPNLHAQFKLDTIHSVS